MLKLSQRTLIFCAGTLWLLIGILLLSKGLALTSLSPLIAMAVGVGYLKGRFVLGRGAAKQVRRVMALKPPLSLKHLYSRGYYFLIGGMMLLGMSLRFLPIGNDVRAFIDIAVGLALIVGAIHYYLFALKVVPE